MLNRTLKIISFLLYSYAIYTSSLFIIGLIISYRSNNSISLIGTIESYFFLFLSPLIWAGLLLWDIFPFLTIITIMMDMAGLLIIGIAFLLLYGIVFFLWYKRQTIPRAWLLALTGLLAGPGIIFFLRPLGDGGGDALGFYVTFSGVNLFYLGLFLTNFLQKRFWPSCWLGNRIRSILKWPCLRT